MSARAIAILAVVFAASLLASLGLGAVPLSPSDLLAALRGEGPADAIAIVHTLRLPRAALGALVGAAIAASGATMQSALRNPLAEPYLLGVSGGAAVGAVLAVAVLGGDPVVVAISAFAGAIAAVLLVLGVARAAGAVGHGGTLVMAGVVIGAFTNAAILLLLARASAGQTRDALWWMMGSLSGASWGAVQWLAVGLVVAGAALWAIGRELDVLALGSDAAAALGLDVPRATARAYLLAAFLAAMTVSAAGLIGFVGLVVPAMARTLGARSARATLAGAAVLGASLVLLADAVARSTVAPSELPLGAITAIVGVPFFLARLRALR